MTATLQPTSASAASRHLQHVRASGVARSAVGPRPAPAAYLERTGPVPVVATGLVTLLIFPLFIWAPMSIPAEVGLLASAIAYFVGSRQLRRRKTAGRHVMGLAALSGLASIFAASFTCHGVASRVDAGAHVMPYCTAAFLVPGVIYVGAVVAAWRRSVGRYAGQA